MLKLSACLQVNGKTVFWKCWKLSLKNFILLNSKLGGGQDDFFGLVSSFKLPHNSQIYATFSYQQKFLFRVKTPLPMLWFCSNFTAIQNTHV